MQWGRRVCFLGGVVRGLWIWQVEMAAGGGGCSCQFGDDQNLGGSCEREMDGSTYGGDRGRGKEKRKIMRKRGECVVTEAKRANSSQMRTGASC